MANAWFIRQPLQDPTEASSYEISNGAPSCSGTAHICAVFAENNGSDLPILDEAVYREMILALDSSTNSTNVKLKS